MAQAKSREERSGIIRSRVITMRTDMALRLFDAHLQEWTLSSIRSNEDELYLISLGKGGSYEKKHG